MAQEIDVQKSFECIVVKEEFLIGEEKVEFNEKSEDDTPEDSKQDIKVEPMDVEESQENGFKCDTCRKVFTCEKTFLIHKQSHFSQSKTCHICNRSFPLVKNVKRHLVMMHVTKETQACPVCGKQLAPKSLPSHMDSFHKEERTEELDRLTDEPLVCKICNKSFWKPELYHQHLQEHEDDAKTVRKSEKRVREVKVKTEPELFECADCGKTFQHKTHLQSHVISHGTPTKQCPYCLELFNHRGSLGNHFNLMHKGLPIGLDYNDEPIMPKSFSKKFYPRVGIFEAMKLVCDGTTVIKAAKMCKVPETTLRRYVKLYNASADIPVTVGRYKNTFTPALEEKLYDYIKEINRKAFGIKRGDFGRLAFEFAEREELEHRFNGSRKTAGCKFVTRFMEKFNLSFLTNDSAFVLKEVGFKKNTVDGFFQLYQELRTEHGFKPERIFNMEEVGCPVMKKKDPASLMLRGSRKATFQAGIEADTQVCVVCCFNAVGQHLPLLFFHPESDVPDPEETPPNIELHPSSFPWITTEGFMRWLKFFIAKVKPTVQDPVLLLMDGYAFFTSIESEILARENFITILGFPLYTSHKMQPFEVSVFPFLKTKYKDLCVDLLYEHTGDSLSLQEILRIFTEAYDQVNTEKVAMQGFMMTGIEPINPDILFNE